MQVGGDRGESHSVASGDTAGRAAPRVRAVKSSAFGEGELSEPYRDPFGPGAALH